MYKVKSYLPDGFPVARRPLDVRRDILPHRAIRAGHQRVHVHVDVDVDCHRSILRHHLPVPAQDDHMDDGADHRYHMDILVGGHLAVRDLHGQQGDIRQGFLRGDMAAGVIQKGKCPVWD